MNSTKQKLIAITAQSLKEAGALLSESDHPKSGAQAKTSATPGSGTAYRSNFQSWKRENLERFAREVADENINLREQLRTIKETA